MSTFNAGAIEARLTLDRTSWGTELKEVKRQIEELERNTISIMIDVDKTNADIQLDNLENDLLVLENDTVGIEVDADVADVNAALDALEARLDALDIRRVTVSIDADADNFFVQASLVEDEMNLLDHDPVNIQVDADTARAQAQLAELEALVTAIDANDINIRADVDRSFVDLIEGGSSGGGSMGLLKMLLLAALALAPVLSVAMTSAVGAVAALAAAFTAAGGAAVVLGGGIALLVKEFKKAKDAGELTPEMKLLDKALTSLNDSVEEFTDRIADKGFELMAQGVQLAADVLPKLAPIFNATADAVSGLLDGIEDFVNSPDFRRMIDFFSDFGADMLGSIGRSIGNLLVFFGRLFEAFEPLAREMMSGLEDLTASWAEWADGLAKNDNFQDFLNDVREYGPQVLDFLGSMVLAFINLGEALEPFAGPMLTGLTAFFDAIAEADPQVLSVGIAAIASAFVAWKVIPPLVSALELLPAILAAISLPAIAVAAAIAGIGYVIYDLWTTNKDFRDNLINTWNEIVENVKPIIDDIAEFIKEHWDEIKVWLAETFEQIKELVFNVFDVITGIINIALETIGFIWEHWGEDIIGVVEAAFRFIGGIISSALRLVNSIFKLFGDILHGRWSKIWDDVKEIWNAFWNFVGTFWSGLAKLCGSVLKLIWHIISDGWNAVWDWAKDKFSDFMGWIHDRWNALIDWFKRLPGRIGGAVSGIWDSLVESFANAINTIIGYWNSLSLTIDIPDKIPGLPDEWTISTPDFPTLAKGGITTGATMAMIGEGTENEAVMPLSRLQEFVDNSRTEIDYGRIGSAVAAALASVLSRSGLSLKREDLELLASMLGITVAVDARDDDSGRALASAVGFQLRLLGLGGKSNV